MLKTSRKIRVGAVNYLNTRPLIYDLEQIAPQIELSLDLPSRLATQLEAGLLDVALIPSFAFFHHPEYQIISDACIGCRGPVFSVKLFSRVPAAQIRTLALDEGSRTSAALVQILLKEKYGVAPQLESLPIGSTVQESQADAVLLIGDRAMHAPHGPFAEVWDLGDQWCRWTELPFVFAMWVTRNDLPAESWKYVEAALSAARDQGVEHLEEIAEREAAALALTPGECLTYLRDNLHFYLGPREQQGLQLFYERSVSLGLAPSGVHLGSPVCRTVG